MNYQQIETFLTVIAHGSITGAAEKLFVSQSTVSSRLQQLEEELGAKLIFRQKGHRSVEITAYGRAFIPIANQWAALWKDTQNLKNTANIHTLNIASVDAVNNFTLLPLFNSHIERAPDVKLSINTFHSEEIHGLVENRTMDIGFVFSQIRYQHVISRPVYRELMYLVCHKDSKYHENMRPEELDPGKEVYLKWGPDFQQWHDRHWDAETYPLISVNTGSMLQHYLQEPGRWAMAPMSVVQAFQKDKEITHYSIQEPPDSRICYMLTNRYPKASHEAAIAAFENELDEFVCENQTICTFEPWMLAE